jgi:hypothetical protein
LTAARLARQEADTFEKDIRSARKDAADALANLADARRLAEDAQKGTARNTEKLADRHLTADQQSTLARTLRPFAGTKVNIFAVGGDSQITGISNDILNALRGNNSAG